MRSTLVFLLFCISCSASTQRVPTRVASDVHGPEGPHAQEVGSAAHLDAEEATTGPQHGATLRIATLNLQNFGPKKASRFEDLRAFAEVIRAFDLVAVQEIQDASGDAPRKLLAALNEGTSDTFAMLLSENSGREPSDKNFHERYAFYFRTAVVSVTGTPQLFDDSTADLFNREPFVGHFRAGDFDFALVTVHTSPEFALEEIGALDEVIRWAATAVDPDVIALGDYNASCTYATSDALDALALRHAPYTWIVPDDADTNVNPASACAYDRIVVTSGVASAFTGRWGVEKPSPWFSDHWPVWAEFAVP